MQIILTSNYSPWSNYCGGGQLSTHHLATSLTRLGYQVDVVFTRAIAETIEVPDNLPYKLHWTCFPGLKSRRNSSFRRFSSIGVYYKVKKLINESNKPVVTHANGEEAALLSTLHGKSGFKLVVTPRYPNLDRVQHQIPNPVSSLLSFRTARMKLLGLTLNGADEIVPTSSYTRKLVKKHFHFCRDRQMKVIANGVSDSFFKASWKGDLRQGPILFYGRLEKAKGVDLVLKAYKQLSEKIDNPLWIAGRGTQERKIRSFITRYNLDQRVRLLPWQNQDTIRSFLEQSSMTVLPSREESFGNTVAESMAAGVPTLSSRAGSVPELITDQQNGFLVESDHTQVLADKIHNTLASPKQTKTIAENAKKSARYRFDWLKIARQHADIYETLLAADRQILK